MQTCMHRSCRSQITLLMYSVALLLSSYASYCHHERTPSTTERGSIAGALARSLHRGETLLVTTLPPNSARHGAYAGGCSASSFLTSATSPVRDWICKSPSPMVSRAASEAALIRMDVPDCERYTRDFSPPSLDFSFMAVVELSLAVEDPDASESENISDILTKDWVRESCTRTAGRLAPIVLLEGEPIVSLVPLPGDCGPG